MKRYVSFTMLVLIVVLALSGCAKEAGENHGSNDIDENTTVTLQPTSADIAEITEEPEVTNKPEVTNEPEANSVTGENDETAQVTELNSGKSEYHDILGTWYLYSSEIEGDAYHASEGNEFCSVTFYPDFTAEYYSIIYYNPRESSEPQEYSGSVRELGEEENNLGNWVVDFGVEDCTYYYSVNEDGNLVQMCDIVYDEGWAGAVSYSVFTREINVTAPEKLEVPEQIRTIMDAAPENCWISVILNPDPDLSAECDNIGWVLHDETDNEWLAYPIVNPVELIVCNSGDRYVDLEVHEPDFDYDPASEDSNWEPGPFMYYDYLYPGDIARFMVTVPDNPQDAIMALYMFFEGESEPYYTRIYNFETNYISFQ